MSELTDQDALKAIDRIAGDEWCEELDMKAAFNAEAMTPFEKMAHEKLSLIYRIAHSFCRSSVCFRVHDDWRKLVGEKYE